MSRLSASKPIGSLIVALVCVLAAFIPEGRSTRFPVLDTAHPGSLADVETGSRSTSLSYNVRTVETAALLGYARGAIHVYFTRPRPHVRDADGTDGLDNVIAAEVDRAQHSIDLASFDFDLPLVAAALLRAHGRGLHLRMVVDSENLEDPLASRTLGTLEQAGIAVTYDRRAAFMHNKFIVIDDRLVWTGSWNLTLNDTFRNNNNVVRIDDPRVAASYRHEFASLVGNREPTPSSAHVVELEGTTMEALFAPDTSITQEVTAAIQGAEHSVHFLAFTFTSDALAEALIEANGRGVQVRGVLENRNADGTGSDFDAFHRAGIPVMKDGNCFQMHHKTIIIDDDTVITGSFNWTAAAQQRNDENVLVLRSPWLAQVYMEEFERVWAKAQQPAKCN